MEILHGLPGLRSLPRGAAMSIGNYDGVHRGHQRLLSIGRDLRAAGAAGLAVVTFEPHPLTVLRPQSAPPRLASARFKEELLASAGVDWLVILPPEPAVLNLAAEEFWAILRDEVHPAHLVEGEGFCFGKNRGGNVYKLRDWAAGTPVRVTIAEAVEAVLLDLSIVRVSSSLIRWLVAHGRVRDAAICLGRPYTLEGPVIKGMQRGRTIGMPTINLDCADQMLPAEGVYAGRCTVGGTTYPAAVSIGTMPTFGENKLQIEAHLVGYSGDLYGTVQRVELLDWLRWQTKYKSVDALKVQLARDLHVTRDLASMDPSREIASPVQ